MKISEAVDALIVDALITDARMHSELSALWMRMVGANILLALQGPYLVFVPAARPEPATLLVDHITAEWEVVRADEALSDLEATLT